MGVLNGEHNMRQTRIAVTIVVMMLAVATVASAGVVQKLDVADLTRMSHAVLVGQVLDTRSEWNSNHEYIQTFTQIRVDDLAKGSRRAGEIITVREIGGSVGDYNQMLIGGATYKAGEKVLVFLQRAKDGTSGVFQTVALSEGKYIVSTDSRTGRPIAVPDAHDLVYVGEQPSMFDNGPVDLDLVIDEIRRHAYDR